MNEKGQYWTILFPLFFLLASRVSVNGRPPVALTRPHCNALCWDLERWVCVDNFFVSKCPLDLHIRRRVDWCFFFLFFFRNFFEIFVESTPSIGGCGQELFCVADGFARWLIIQIIHIWRMICENCEKFERFFQFFEIFSSAPSVE